MILLLMNTFNRESRVPRLQVRGPFYLFGGLSGEEVSRTSRAENEEPAPASA